MKIVKKFKVNTNKYIRNKTTKRQIVLGNIYHYNVEKYFNLLQKLGGAPDCPHFSVDNDGKIYQHFNTEYYSRYLNTDLDEYVISIGLLNLGYLFKEHGKYYDIYNSAYYGIVIDKKWKNCDYWQPYTEKQLESVTELCKFLIESENIEPNVSNINVYKQDITNFKGITYRSNHDEKHYDVNPTWDFEKFKKLIEENG